MKKIATILILFISSVTLYGCEFSANDLSGDLGNAIGEQINDVTDEIGERIEEKVSETVDQAKEEMVDKAEDTLADGFSEIRDGIIEDIGIQVDKLVEYKPGIWFEDASVITYEIHGLKMNCFWEADEESGRLEIIEDTIVSNLPEGAIVTVSFFENLPETVKVFEKKGDLGEAIEVAEMENPLTGKSTYSFLVIYEEQEMKEFTMLCEAEDMEDVLFEITFHKE